MGRSPGNIDDASADSGAGAGALDYRLAFDRNPQPMWVIDAETLQFLAVNDAAVAHYGWSREEFLSMTALDIRPASDRGRVKQKAAAERGKREVVGGAWKHRLRDGTIIDVAIFAEDLPFGGRRAWLVLAVDVTERVGAELDLRRRLEQQAAVASLGDEAAEGTAPQALMERALEAMMRILDADVALVVERAEEGDGLIVRAGRGIPNELVGAASVSVEANFQIAHTLRCDQSVIVADQQAEKRFDDEPLLRDLAITSGASTVIEGEHGPSGVLSVHSREPMKFDERDINFLQSVAGVLGTAISRRAAVRLERELQESRLRSVEETVRRLSMAVEMRDAETGGHSERIARISAHLASRLQLPEHRVELLRTAAAMHDVGKIGVPDAILLKPGPLTPDERAQMERHAEVGHSLLSGSEAELLDLAAVIALSHHERFDGTGYPRRLPGATIPLEGRIVAVADVFDALTSERVYRPAFALEDAVAMMRDGRGTQFDPWVLDALLDDLDHVFEIANADV